MREAPSCDDCGEPCIDAGPGLGWQCVSDSCKEKSLRWARAAVDGWQPIETLKEGERVLVSYLYHGNRYVDITEKYRGECLFPSNFHIPTHWMPLPEPPKEQP